MGDYTISFTGRTCLISNMTLAKDDKFELAHNESINSLIIENSSIPCLTKQFMGSFVNIKVLKAVSIGIETVSEDAFTDCKYLQQINLSKNKIKELEVKTFARNPCLRIVILAENHLESLPKELFLNSDKLNILDLSSNNLTSLSKKLFNHTMNVIYINVSHNQLTDLKVESIIEQLPELKQISLSDNDFNASKLMQILKSLEIVGIKCTPSDGKIRKRSYTTQLIYGFKCIPDVEYDRLVAKRKIIKLEQKLEAMQKKMDLMQENVSFLLKEHEIQMNKKKNQENTKKKFNKRSNGSNKTKKNIQGTTSGSTKTKSAKSKNPQ